MLKTVISRSGAFYLVSTVNASLSGWETLVFPCTRDGNVTDWGELDGYRYSTEGEAINGHTRFVETFQP